MIIGSMSYLFVMSEPNYVALLILGELYLLIPYGLEVVFTLTLVILYRARYFHAHYSIICLLSHSYVMAFSLVHKSFLVGTNFFIETVDIENRL
jgi:hypothetical protein